LAAVTEEQSGANRRLLLVHAHPDDESIGNGATMARYVAEGADVCLVTCTLGEEGEVLVGEFGHLAAEQADELGQHRLGELKLAMENLGVTDFLRLGGDHRYRDSGMAWSEGRRGAVPRDVLRPGIFWTADLLEAANELVPVIRSRRPQVLVTYNEWGGYGHPDHIQAHRVAMYAYLLAGVRSYRPDLGTPWTVSRVLWNAMSESRMREGIRALRAAGDTKTWEGMDPDGELPPMIAPDREIDVEIDGTPWVRQKLGAMRAHATQITPDGQFFSSEPVLGDQAWSHEYYRLAVGVPFAGTAPEEGRWADDLFAGLA
jgi:N-acetyl-1-D-myo-inositol-2-amino-2-deoxy-alpha-D-glucopyranoside deacetylase